MTTPRWGWEGPAKFGLNTTGTIGKQGLDEATAKGCGMPGCTEDHSVLYLHCRKHPGSGVEVSYRSGSGVLVVSCAECHSDVGRFRLGER